MNPNFVLIYDYVINKNQITDIEFKVYGSDCGASFEQKDDYFVVIHLVNNRTYKIHHSSVNLISILEDLEIADYWINYINNN